MSTLGERIKKVRCEIGEKKMSMAAFAERLKTSPTAVFMWEAGERNPSPIYLRTIADEFGVNESWLLTGEGDMKAPLSEEAEIAQMAVQMFDDKDPIRRQLFKLVASLDEETLITIKETWANILAEEK